MSSQCCCASAIRGRYWVHFPKSFAVTSRVNTKRNEEETVSGCTVSSENTIVHLFFFLLPFGCWSPVFYDLDLALIRTRFTVAIWKRGDVRNRENSDWINRACKHQILLIPMSRRQLTYSREDCKNPKPSPVISVLLCCVFCVLLCSPACISLHTCPASAVLARPRYQHFFPPACQPSSCSAFLFFFFSSSSFHLSCASPPISPPAPHPLVGSVRASVQLSVQSRCALFTCSSRWFWTTVPPLISLSAVSCVWFNLPCSQYNMYRLQGNSAYAVFLCNDGFQPFWWAQFGFYPQMTRVFNNPSQLFLHAARLFVFLISLIFVERCCRRLQSIW